MQTIDCGLIEFRAALALQERLAAAIASGEAEETLLLARHPPVYTIGRGGQSANILDPQLSVERIGRGGDVTWHGPGQVVLYPLFNLGRRGRDLHRWLRLLEAVLLATLSGFGIAAHCQPGATGVWTSRGKIGFIGVGVRRWITMHGASLNVCPDLAAFARINPCGMAGCPVTSMVLERGESLPETVVMQRLHQAFVQLLPQWTPLQPQPEPSPARSMDTGQKQCRAAVGNS